MLEIVYIPGPTAPGSCGLRGLKGASCSGQWPACGVWWGTGVPVSSLQRKELQCTLIFLETAIPAL